MAFWGVHYCSFYCTQLFACWTNLATLWHKSVESGSRGDSGSLPALMGGRDEEEDRRENYERLVVAIGRAAVAVGSGNDRFLLPIIKVPISI